MKKITMLCIVCQVALMGLISVSYSCFKDWSTVGTIFLLGEIMVLTIFAGIAAAYRNGNKGKKE